MTKIIRILGLDPSLANTGWAIADIDLTERKIVRIVEHGTSVTAKSKVKSVRKSSDDLQRARVQRQCMTDAIDRYNVKIACSEVPSGAQSASASRAFGIVVGLLASLSVPMIETNPTEVKMASVGSKVADKEDIVRWAVELTQRLGGTEFWNTGKAKNEWEIELDGKFVTKTMEHQADAIAVIAAAIATQEFKQIAAVLAQF
jgi:Holliday junction resolvasome RuvABC endonuclease subunit